jgi:hypothetical protein
MATKQVKKKAESLTIEQRVARIERSLSFLAAKLKTHGIHLAPDTQAAPEPEERDEE